jgi:hypothetical protein
MREHLTGGGVDAEKFFEMTKIAFQKRDVHAEHCTYKFDLASDLTLTFSWELSNWPGALPEHRTWGVVGTITCNPSPEPSTNVVALLDRLSVYHAKAEFFGADARQRLARAEDERTAALQALDVAEEAKRNMESALLVKVRCFLWYWLEV